MPETRFEINEAKKTEGFKFSGFETFRGAPYKHCAREAAQNSRDAATSVPVKLEFALLNVPRTEIPFADEVEAAIDCCLRNYQTEETREFLSRAKETIASEEMLILKMSDLNTTGLMGPVDDPLSVFSAFAKGDGFTVKPNETSAGSYGIGKNAGFAVSELHMVVCSTVYVEKDSGKRKFAAQGRLRLISHENMGRNYKSEGYWGAPDFLAIEEPSDVPSWMRREEVGTSIFSVGFRITENWKQRMVLSLATNFFLAISRGEMEFSVSDSEGRLEITKTNLESVLASEELSRVASDADESDDLARARALDECFRSQATTQHTLQISGLGDFTLHLLVKDGMPRGVHFLRNGIYITSGFAKFGDSMSRFSGVREFIAAVEPARDENGKKPSKLTKRLENPAHDNLEPERIDNVIEREEARRQIKQLAKLIREQIKQSAKIDHETSSTLDELAGFFVQEGSGKLDGVEEDPEKVLVKTAEPKNKERSKGVLSGNQLPGKSNQTKSKTRVAGKSTREHGSAPMFSDLRTAFSKSGDTKSRVFLFTPTFTGTAQFEVLASGLNTSVGLEIKRISGGAVNGAIIEVAVEKGIRKKILAEFKESYSGPVEIRMVKVMVRKT
jgi:hypothetical protein